VKVSEAAFQQVVIDVARWHGWKVFHPLPAQNAQGRWRTAQAGDTGFPDLVLAHPKRGVIFAELKSAIGKLSDHQQTWLATLKQAGAEVYVWRPADIEQIKAILKESRP
jgi:hypothetical protein